MSRCLSSKPEKNLGPATPVLNSAAIVIYGYQGVNLFFELIRKNGLKQAIFL